MASQFTAASSEENSFITQRPLKVIIADDEPDIVMTLVEILRDEGHDAKGFTNGREALAAIREFEPDVIISDIAMPSPNGWDLARQARAIIGARPLMIAITGQYTKSADQVLSEIVGFNYYLTKPCDPQVVVALVKNARRV